MDTHRNPFVFFAYTLCFIVAGLGGLSKNSNGQSATRSTQPFIGFRPFGESETASAAGIAFGNNERSSFSQSTNTRSNTSNTRSVYPYPAGPNIGSLSNDAGSAPERATLNSRLSGSRVPTGSLNRSLGQATMPLVGMDPALARRYQQELQQRQAEQFRSQQNQLWLQQQRLRQQQLQRQRVAQNVASSPQPTPARRPEQSGLPARAQNSSVNFQTKPKSKLNQAVVQQVSSTSTSNRDTRVARANFDRQPPSADAAFGSNNTNTVAKPQSCCVPVNCCQPAMTAQTFRPQAANQIPSLNPGSAPAGSFGFLGQNGAGYQAQAQSGYQFQPGLGVPQFASTGSFGNGGWFSNLVRGTGAYRPLLPLEPLYPNARPGRGIIGQPTAYVDGQPMRNLLRYLMP